MSELVLIFIIGLVVFYWLSAARCKEIATLAARRECKYNSVQLLDQTVQQTRISMSRDANHIWRIWRHYKFDYSMNGDDRKGGEVVLLGHNVIRTYLSLPPIH
jgi:mannosyltransferase OCH1-like enzyme